MQLGYYHACGIGHVTHRVPSRITEYIPYLIFLRDSFQIYTHRVIYVLYDVILLYINRSTVQN